MLGLDYSGGRPSGAAIYAASYRFVVRYLENGLGGGRYNLTAAEFADLRANGVAVALVWESQANRAAAGHDAGVADARAALAAADAVGASGWPIYFAVDFDIPDYAPAAMSALAKLGPVGDYLAGAASVLGHSRTGVYGGYYAVSRALDAGLASLAWQTEAWSGGQVDPRIHLLQRLGTVVVDGVECDTNEARQASFGQQPPGAVRSPNSEDDDMWKFLVDEGTVQTDGSYTRCAELLPTAELIGTSWADISAKLAEAKAGGAPASVRGVDTAVFDDYEKNSDAHKAATAALAKLTSGGGGVTAAPTSLAFDLAVTGTATPKTS
jgi:hypothetical protein